MNEYLLLSYAYGLIRKIIQYYIKNIDFTVPGYFNIKATNKDKMYSMFISTIVSPIMTPFWVLRDITGITNATTPTYNPLNMIFH